MHGWSEEAVWPFFVPQHSSGTRMPNHRLFTFGKMAGRTNARRQAWSQTQADAKARRALKLEAHAVDRFKEAIIGVVRDNPRQLKFDVESTGFE
jgi:hypothetical protein